MRVHPNSAHHRGIQFSKPLNTLAVTVGLLTPDRHEVPFWYKSYAGGIIIFLAFSCAWSVYEKFNVTYRELSKTTINIDLILGTLLAVVNISTITKAVINRKTLAKLLKKLNEIDNVLDDGSCFISNIRQNVFIVELLMILLAIFGYATYDIYVQISVTGAIISTPRLLMIVNDYFIALSVLMFYTLMIVLKDRFSSLNYNLYRIVRKNKKSKVRNGDGLSDMLDMSKTYHNLCGLIDLVNKHCGFQLLGTVTLIFVYVMQLVNMTLNYYKEKEIFINTIPIIHFIREYCVISILYMAFGIMIASSCELVIKRATDTAHICHKLLLEYPLCDKANSQEHLLQEELLLLAHQVTHRKPKFTAADFFTVDYSMLYGMLGSIVSYIVIIIQLK